MSEHILVTPIGNGLTLRLVHAPAQRLTARLYRGRWPGGKEVVLSIAHRDDIHLSRVTGLGDGRSPSVWVGSTNFEVSATAAKRLSAWLAAQGIGRGEEPADDLPTELNTDTPAPRAPGACA